LEELKMAQRTQVTLVDDVDQETPAEGTRTFVVDGKTYRLDLNKKNLANFDESYAEMVAWAEYATEEAPPAGSANGTRRYLGSTSRGISRSAEDRERSTRIRNWAVANGLEVAMRGRVPASVVAAFEKAEAETTSSKKRGKAAA
jgi:nucleoid-associated protein Lsr2